MDNLIKLLISTLASWVITTPALACTDFRLIANDGTILITRSMEFSQDLSSNVRTSTRERVFAANTLNGKPTMTWKAKYGYIYVDALNQDMAVDGMNEVGLSVEALFFPGETQYQTVPIGKESQAIPYFNFGDWVLSNFKSVEEVKAALTNTYVYTQAIPGLGNAVYPLHFAIYDALGKGIVIEYTPGRVNVYDNTIGTMTNCPAYDWQVTNLRNYVNLSAYNPTPVIVGNMTFAATGQGAGMMGLPGDTSPPSRFVKTTLLRKVVYPVADATSVLNLAQHIINNVDIPLGLVRAMVNNKESAELTQWVVFKDLTHRQFYYRTYNDMTIRQIQFSLINLAAGAPMLKMPMATPPFLMDVTKAFTLPPTESVAATPR